MSLIALSGITRRYPGVTALDAVDFAVAAGSVHALLGENGAGKSTLLRILGGAERPDTGTLTMDGDAVVFGSPRDALDRGILVIHQELALVPQLGAAANVFLGRELTRRGLLARHAMRERTAAALRRLGMTLDPDLPVSHLSIAQRQLIELARAIVHDARFVALDEPTATLSPREVEHLFGQVRELAGRGSGIVFVSHRLDEVRRLADTVTVLRDGQHVWTGRAADVTDEELIIRMVGRTVEYVRVPAGCTPEPDPVLTVEQLSRPPSVRDASLVLRRGEIVGLAGLVGAGRTEVARCIAGIDRPATGTITYRGDRFTPASPGAAIRAGVVYLPEDRKRDGLVLGATVRENVTLPTLRRYAQRGVLRLGAERRAAEGAVRDADVRPPDVMRTAGTLSGGNQQKVVLARWLLADAEVLLFDEPTRGMDVGAKVELHRQIRSLADAGKAVLVISSELPELLALADRVVVMREGRVTGEVAGDRLHAEAIMQLAVAG